MNNVEIIKKVFLLLGFFIALLILNSQGVYALTKWFAADTANMISPATDLSIAPSDTFSMQCSGVSGATDDTTTFNWEGYLQYNTSSTAMGSILTTGTIDLVADGINPDVMEAPTDELTTVDFLSHTITAYDVDIYWVRCRIHNLLDATDFYSVAKKITVSVSDNEFPIFSNYKEFPANNTAYSPSATYKFNATITSSNGTAGLDFSGTNYSASNLSDVFNTTITDLGVGTYSYYWWAFGNGTSANYNTSETRSYTISKTTGDVSLLLNGATENLSIQYPQQSNITSSTNYGTVTIYKDGTDITSENGLNFTRAVGYYNITSVSSGNQNYTSVTQEYWLNITKAVPTGSLTNTDDWTVEYPQEVTIGSSESNSGDEDLAYVVNRDEVNKGTEETITLGVGTYEYLLNTSGGANYSANVSMDTQILTIQQNISLQLGLTITPSQSETFGTETTATGSGCPTELTCTLYREHVSVGAGPDIQTLGVAVYNYTYNTTGNANYSATSISKLLTITKVTPVVYTYLDNSRSNTSISNNTVIWLNSTLLTGDSGATLQLYNNGTLINSGTSPLSNFTAFNTTGLFNITTIYVASQNYTTSSETWWVNVTASPADSDYPQFSDFQEYLANNSDYLFGQAYQFNITVTNTNGTVFLEFNGTNYSASNDTSTNFYVDFSSLTAGNYNYYWGGYGNGTSELYNISGIRDYVVKKINPVASLTNTDAWEVTYPEEVTIGLSESNNGDTDVTYIVNRDDVNKATGETITLGYGTYDYVLNTTGGQNYTANESIDAQTLTVNQNTGACDVLFNETSPINYSSTFKVWTNCNSDFTLYRNGTVISNNSVQDLSAGGYNFTVIRTDNVNYSIISDEQIFIVQKAEGVIYTYINHQRSDKSILVNNENWLNATLITGVGDIELYYNGTIINQGASPLSNLTNFADEGVFNISGIYLGNENYTSASETWWATVSSDSAPTLSLVYPQNINYNTDVSELNYTVSDDIALDICWYSINNGVANTTITCGNNVTGLTSTEGSNTWTIWANDSIGQKSSDSVTFNKDTLKPLVTSLTESPSDPATYSSETIYEFNATITDTNLETILIEFNGINYTPSNSGDVYNFSISDLSVGVYNYYWYVNDSYGNINNSESGDYTIDKADPSSNMAISGTTPIEYGITSDFSESETNVGDGGCSYSMDLSNGIYGVGTWTFNYSTSGCANYTAGSVTKDLIVNKNTSLTLGLTATTPIEYPTTTDFTGSNCPAQLTCSLNISNAVYQAGDISANYSTAGNNNYSATSTDFTITINQNSSYILGISGTTPITYGTTTDVAGSDCPSQLSCSLDKSNIVYGVGESPVKFNYSTIGNTNYTANSITKDITINQAIPTGTLTSNLGWIINESQEITIGLSESNTEDNDVSYNVFRDDVDKGTGETWTPSLGTYNYILNTTGGQNYTANASMDVQTLTVNDVTLPIVSIVYPINGTTYTIDVSELNYTLTEINSDSCWYSINGGVVNTSITCGDNATGLNSIENLNTWTIWANDTSGNENSSSVTFSKDTAYPDVAINSPLNQTYNTNSILFNITATDGGEISSCWYSLDSGINNNSMTNLGDEYTDTNSTMTQGSHTANFYCNDSFNNLNNSEQETFFIDSIYPFITSLTETPSDPVTYSSGITYEFNATISDTNLKTVLIEFDGTNYTPSNLGDVYNFSILNLPAGIYSYSWFANDTINNINLTETQTYTINNATGDITLLINGSESDQTATYGVQTNASSTTSYGTLTIYKDGIDVTSENNNLVTLGVGYYNYTAVSLGDQNHSSATITRFVNITKANSEVNLTLNETAGNITIPQDNSILLNGTLVTGDSGATLRLYNDGTLINQGTIEVSNQTDFNIIGLFNITILYLESQNYTGSSKTFWVNITEAPDLTNPSVTSLTETPSDPANYSPETIYEFNATIIDNREIDLVFIEFDGTNYTPSNLSNVYNFSISNLGVGIYSYSWFANDTSGNVNNTQSGTYAINKTIPSLDLTITPSQSETFGTETTATGSGCPTELTCNLYREHGVVDNSDTQTLGVAVYNYTYNTTGNTNYSTASISKLLTITQATGVVYTYLDNSRSNKSISNNTEIWLNSTLITGSGEIKIYNNGTLINQGSSPLSNYTLFDQVGLYNITTIYEGNENYTSASETWWVDVLAVDLTNPAVAIIYPQNISYDSIQTELNYSASDNQELDSCWYSVNGGWTNTTITCGDNVTGLNSGQGSSTWIVYTNDTNGNKNSSSVVFFVDSIFPTINFVAPTKTSNSSTNENLIEINVSANDTNLDTIVIRLYNSTNDLIKTNFSTNNNFFINYTGLPAGIYYYNATVNDTLNNQNSTETRAINLTLPSLTIHKPQNKTYIANTSLLLDYSVTNATTVWYNIDSVQNTTITSNTYFNTSEGSHTLYLYANNSNGVITKNVTFSINMTLFEIESGNWEDGNRGESTNFNEYSFDEIQNLSNITLENTLYGKIIFDETINLTDDENPSDNQIDLDSYINISGNRIEINSTALPNFNKSATLNFYNLTFSNPRILRDGIICASTICTQNNYLAGVLSFNVTGFTIYSSEETPIEEAPSEPVVSGGGGGGGIIIYECFNDSDCESKDEVCLNYRCVKLFDIKIIDFESPIKLGEFFDFTYFLKGMGDINNDVEIEFWIEKQGEVVTSGSDVIYFGSYEEKTETSKIFLPKIIDSGIYTFFVQVNYKSYKAQSHRTIEIEVEDGVAKIISKEPKELKDYFYYILGILVLIILILLIRIAKKNNYLEIFKNWKIKKETLDFLEEVKVKKIVKPSQDIEVPENRIKDFFNSMIISLKEFKSKLKESKLIEKKPVYNLEKIEKKLVSKPIVKKEIVKEKSSDELIEKVIKKQSEEKVKEKLESPMQKYKPEKKEILQIPKKKFAEQIIVKIKEKIPKQFVKIPLIKKEKNLPNIIPQEKIKLKVKEEPKNIIENIVKKEIKSKDQKKSFKRFFLRKKRNIDDIKEMFEENPETQIKKNSEQNSKESKAE